uniref:Conserved oligomeric Golgi complex subunit 4 n=1 Tax=Panagrolaimus sp. PS1159 TaxID=55785 RepID=A0AC35G8L6_9BILA
MSKSDIFNNDFGYYGMRERFERRGPLEWRPKSIKSLTNDAESNRSSESSNRIKKLRESIQTERDKQEQAMLEINKEISTSGLLDKDKLRAFDQALARLANRTETIELSAQSLASNLKSVSILADSISSQVRELDVAKSRVVECLLRVNDLRDLRTCSENVVPAIANEDFEEACQYIHRFHTLEGIVAKMGTRFDLPGSGQSMKSSYETLQNAAADLKIIIETNFDAAVASGDTASMERFFKLFPLLNDHANGLQKFGAYLCRKIEKSCKDFFKIMESGGTDDTRRNVLYSDTMTMVLEEIAREVMEYQPLIDSYYGPDKLLYLMEIIQAECDKQSTLVLDAFIKNRQFEQRTKTVREFLRGNQISEKLDPIALDVLLSEVTLIHTRAELYWRFLKRRLGDAPARPLSESGDPPKSPTFASDDFDDDDELTEEERKELQEKQKRARTERTKKLDTVLNRSKLGMRMQEILGNYVMMEQYYMLESVSKALEMEDSEENSLTTSILDDVFFIVRKCIRRSITSSSVDCVCAMINNGMSLLETNYLDRLNAAIRAGYPSTGWTAEAYQHAQTAYNVLQHGKSVAEAGPEMQKKVFLAALNNIRASIQSIVTLKEGLMQDFEVHFKQINTTDKSKLENSLYQFDELSRKFEQMASIAVNKLSTAAFRPRLKAAAETYIDFSHELTEEQLNDFESVDPFIENFIGLLDEQIHKFEDALLPENYEELLESVSVETAHQMERVIYKCGFNHLGGIQLDKEYRQLASYLTNIAGWKVREKCSKLSQIVNILSSDSIEEAVNFFKQLETSSSGILTINELKKILYLRVDFSKDKIKSLKL